MINRLRRYVYLCVVAIIAAVLLAAQGCGGLNLGDGKCFGRECQTAIGAELVAIIADPERKARALSAVKIAAGLACAQTAVCPAVKVAAKVRQVAATVAKARAAGADVSADYAEVMSVLGALRNATVIALAEGS